MTESEGQLLLMKHFIDNEVGEKDRPNIYECAETVRNLLNCYRNDTVMIAISLVALELSVETEKK